MINRIIHFSVYHRGTVLLLTAMMGIVGWITFENLPIDAVPDVTNNQVQIITVAPTLAAQEVEQYITAPVEVSCSAVPEA